MQLTDTHPTQRCQTLDLIHDGSEIIDGHSRQLQEQILCGEMLAGVAVFFPSASAGGLLDWKERGREGGREDE